MTRYRNPDEFPQRPVPVYDPPLEPLDIVHQDDEILIVIKPTGLLSVPGTRPGTDDNLHARAIALNAKAQIVHRLDWDTSGLMVLALTPHAGRHLGAQFENRQVEKHYMARVWGRPQETTGTIDLPLRCDWPNRPRQIVDYDEGRQAITNWQVQKVHDEVTDLLMKPRTGRSHQLRVHCLALGHPIVGDRLYAHEEAYRAHSRMCLHSSFLAFDHPVSGERLEFSSRALF